MPALLAPTAINQQKFTFSLTNGNQVRAKAGWGYFSKVDLGIVKLHFEMGAGTENFECSFFREPPKFFIFETFWPFLKIIFSHFLKLFLAVS